MNMGRKRTVLWDERESDNSIMLFTCFYCCCCPSQCALPTQCPIGHFVEGSTPFRLPGEEISVYLVES